MPTGPTRFVVQMHWAFQTQGHLFLVLDYCSGARAAWLSCAKMCGRLRNLTSSSNIGSCESRRPAFGSAINPPFNEVAPLWTKWTCRPPKKGYSSIFTKRYQTVGLLGVNLFWGKYQWFMNLNFSSKSLWYNHVSIMCRKCVLLRCKFETHKSRYVNSYCNHITIGRYFHSDGHLLTTSPKQTESLAALSQVTCFAFGCQLGLRYVC